MRQRFEHKTITILSNKSLPQYWPKVAARITLEIGTSTCACVRAYLWWKWPPAQNQCVSSDIWVSVLIKLTVCAIAKWCSRCANSWLCVLCHVIYTNRYICSGRIQTVTQAHTLTLVPLLSMLYSVHTLTHNAVVQLSITCTHIFLSNFGQQAKPCSGQRSQEQPPHQRHTTTTTPTSTPVANVCVCVARICIMNVIIVMQCGPRVRWRDVRRACECTAAAHTFIGNQLRPFPTIGHTLRQCDGVTDFFFCCWIASCLLYRTVIIIYFWT